MITAILIDDDQHNSIFLSNLIAQFCPQLSVMGTADNVNDGLELIVKLTPQLIFLDIELHDKNAIEILKLIDLNEIAVILLTAHEKYAVEMHKYDVTGYILKPLQITDLLQAVKKGIDHIKKYKEISQANQDAFMETLIAIPDKGFLNVNKPENILHLESKGNYTTFTTLDGKKPTSSKSIKDYEDILPKSMFLRVHHSHIVNMKYIVKYNRSKNGYLVMQDGREIPVSASRKKEINQRIRF